MIACSLTGYEWDGKCNGILLDRSGLKLPLRDNAGYLLTYTIPANGIPINVGIHIGDATLAQIGPDKNGHAFPPLKNRAAGTAFLYMFVEATHNVPRFSLTGPELIEIASNSGFPGKTQPRRCSLWTLSEQLEPPWRLHRERQPANTEICAGWADGGENR